MICEFQKQHELDYADRRKAMDEKNGSTALDNTTDDIQEARDDNRGDDARALQEMIVLNSPWFGKGNARIEFPVSSVHKSINGCRPVLCQRADRIKYIHTSEAGDQGHRPSHVEEAAPVRVPTLGPHDQAVPGCACQLFVSES
jgi:hypothetical protein